MRKDYSQDNLKLFGVNFLNGLEYNSKNNQICTD